MLEIPVSFNTIIIVIIIIITLFKCQQDASSN